MAALYQILAIAVIAIGVLRGIKRGATGQIDSLLGLGFGLTAARILHEDIAEYIMHQWPEICIAADPLFLPEAIGTMMVFAIFYAVMIAIGPLLYRILASLHGGVINIMVGVVIGVAKYVVMLSFVFNILIGINPSSALLKSAEGDDGNLSEGVLLVAPAFTGTQNFEDYAHAIQMAEAAKISCNQKAPCSVINNKLIRRIDYLQYVSFRRIAESA